jgi:site-specific DNA-methyltransferase (adenine-specific)
VLFRSDSDEWPTDPQLFAQLNEEFNFDLDVCATHENAKCARHFTKEDNGLAQSWTGRVWCNPPYGKTIGLWIRKARESAESGEAEFVVCLVPSRTDTRWWHTDVAGAAEVRFFQGRLRFGDLKWSAPFASALLIFRNANLRYETAV